LSAASAVARRFEPPKLCGVAHIAKANRIVHGILADHGAKSLIKSKSMLTEECGMGRYMAVEIDRRFREPVG
jgi:hypothetical protein